MGWYRLRFPLVLLWVALLALAAPRALHVGHGLVGSGLDNPRSSATWADHQLSRIGRGPAPASGAHSAGPLSTLVQGLPLADVRAAWDQAAASAGSPAPSADVTPLPGHPTDVLVDILPGPSAAAASAAFQQAMAGRSGATLQTVTEDSAGNGVLGSAMTTLRVAGLVALPLLAVLLLLVYDSAVAALLPLVVAVVGAVGALAVIDLLEPYMQLSVYLTNIVSFLALGVGVDYSLFLSSRFRTALRREGGGAGPASATPLPAAGPAARSAAGRGAVAAALSEAMRTSGRSVIFSAVAVAASMLALLLPRTPYWSGLAVGGCVGVLCVLLATTTLLPALLAMLGTASEWGRLPRPDWLGRFWPWVAGAVTRRPGWVLAAGMALLAVPAAWSPGISVRTPADVATMLAPTDPARLALAQEQKDYGAGSISPLPVVLLSPTPLTAAGTWQVAAAVTERLQSLPGALSVASPIGGGVPAQALAAAFGAPGGPPAALAAATAAPDLIALSVTSRYGPDDPQTTALLDQMQSILGALPAGWRGGVGGATALLQAFNQLVASTLPAMIGVVAAVALVVLFAASGSLPIALLAVLFDGLVALATAGLLVLVVQGGRFGFEPLPLDASITPLIFVVLFGLSMDYEVILIHRIREYAARGLRAAEAGRRGLGETGGMITGAGLLMVVAFGSLLLSPLQLMRTMALGMSAAILLDTWLVRSCLVPTSIALLGRWAWWPFGLVAARERGGSAPARAAD